MTAIGIDDDRQIVEAFQAATRLWWIFLVIGTLWLLFAIMVFRFDWRSVSAISIVFGVIMLAAALDEVLAAFAGGQSGWMVALRLVVAAALVVIGVIAFIHPGNTFAALAAVMSFYFIIKGAFTIVVAIATRKHADLWWLLLLLGLAELLLGFWAAGDFGHRQILLIVWVGAVAFARGISAIVFGFRVRDLREAAA
jgi:uncharacterized membrane protein HdeD (DUF308 family)